MSAFVLFPEGHVFKKQGTKYLYEILYIFSDQQKYILNNRFYYSKPFPWKKVQHYKECPTKMYMASILEFLQLGKIGNCAKSTQASSILNNYISII